GEELLIWYGDEYGKELGYSLENTQDEVTLIFYKKVEKEAEGPYHRQNLLCARAIFQGQAILIRKLQLSTEVLLRLYLLIKMTVTYL
ncbi:hypothetical protein Avbf_06838, partial [Armadillidium vulgare]